MRTGRVQTHLVRRALCLACLVVACRGEPPKSDARADTSPLRDTIAASCAGHRFDGAGIGAVRIGATVDSVRKSCRVVRDTTETRQEGLPTRVLAIEMLDDTLEAEIDSGRVWRIRVTHPRFRTADSIGVGTPIGRLLELPGVRGLTGEGSLYLMSPAHCGLSFRMTDPKHQLQADWTLATLRRLPSTSVVTEILVLGCR